MNSGKVLLINPWIYDFAAFDMWSRPLGLLYIGGVLRANGYEIKLVNCLDRYHPELLKFQNLVRPKGDEFGCGKFYKEIIEKPAVLKNVPRRYGRYGLPLHIFRKILSEQEKPDVVLVTSGMTYWYPGVFEAIREVRKNFPGVPVVLGGTYATLCYDHAVENSGADYVVKGEGEMQALNLVDDLLGKINNSSDNMNAIEIFHSQHSPPPGLPHQGGGNLVFTPSPLMGEGWDGGESLSDSIDDYPYPAYDLLTDKGSLAILSSRGCPLGCTYCASKIVAGKFRQRNPVKVADEIEFCINAFGTENFAFYDDALLINPEGHISVILDEVIGRGLKCNFHTPNGMHASQISGFLARQMLEAGFKTIRISLETSNPERQRRIGNKIDDEGFKNAVENLKTAGYEGKDIGVYVLIGLPGQDMEEITESIKYVHECGAVTKIAVYSPIPGTVEWKRAVEEFGLDRDADPLLHNDSIFPVRSGGMTLGDFQKAKAFALECNERRN